MPIDTDKRAKELHSLLDKRSQNSSTTAVRNTQEQITLVGTSDKYIRKAIFEALQAHETTAESKLGNHAEENIIEMAEKMNLHLIEIGASRPICLDCEELLKEKGIEAKTNFSGKKSKNRQ